MGEPRMADRMHYDHTPNLAKGAKLVEAFFFEAESGLQLVVVSFALSAE